MEDTNLMAGDTTTADTTAGAGDDKATTTTADASTTQLDAAKTADAPADKADPAKAAAPVIPEKYEFKAPDGFVVDEALAAEFSPVLRELNLTQEAADKLVAFAPRLISQSVDAAVAQTLESIGYGGSKEWANTARADKEFGGEKLQESLGIAKAARDQFASPELRKLLDTTPLGNHPEIVRLFCRVGKAISQDGYVPGGKAKTATNTAQSMYSASKMNP